MKNKKDLIDRMFESENPLPIAIVVIAILAAIYFSPHLVQYLAIFIRN